MKLASASRPPRTATVAHGPTGLSLENLSQNAALPDLIFISDLADLGRARHKSEEIFYVCVASEKPVGATLESHISRQ